MITYQCNNKLINKEKIMIGKFVFVNLVAKDVAAAREFYSSLGFEINTVFSTERNVFVNIAQNVQLILGEESFFKELGERREFADASKVTEATIAISVGSREEVDDLFNKAIAAGGKPFGDTVEEKEFGLYARAFSDLDGHKVDINYMSA
jgi:predicted lactoylglutathione lyase